ncbi:hypothetical protein KUTeg_012744 [Tegillarca granosa]|uniref:Cytochrome P450 n=1 Tax=Tegillarca granosa TaxID=220873 RepID=A0ABQ9F0E4_TEGGR|nr:hypothetical protein KUTeg_012744 [Tegillarca granosa]
MRKMDVFGILSVPDWLLILFMVLITYFIYMTRNRNFFKKLGVPVPSGSLPIFGHILIYSKKGQYITEYEWMQKYGKIIGTFEGTEPQLLVLDTDILRRIMVKDFSYFPDRRVFDGMNSEMDHSLVAIKGDHWKHVRDTLTPTFSSGKLKRMMSLITSASTCLVDNTKLKIKESENQDLKRVFGGYTMDVIASTAFGIQVDSQSNPNDSFVINASKLFNFDFAIFFPFAIPLFGKLGLAFTSTQACKFFRELVLKIMGERKVQTREYKDFLQLMLEAKKAQEESLTIDEIVGQSVLFFGAGYETTAVTLSLLAYNLARNPEKQQKLYEEITTKLGSERPTYENIQELEYVEMCINETLRFDRICIKDAEINGLTIPKGTVVGIPVYAIHHCPDYWENPEEFMPERFSREEKSKINPLHFLPFGYGPRNCIGMRLAYAEAKVAVIDFYRNFKVSLCDETQIPPKFPAIGLLNPQNMVLKVEQRQD